MDVVLYLRQSSDRSGEELGITRQREGALTLAKLRGWQVVGEHVDNDVSAAGKRHRPGFEAMLSALAAGQAGGVIVWDITRLTRNHRDTLRVLETGQAVRAVIACVQGSDLNLGTADGRTMAGILASIAQGEIDKKAERQRAANDQAAAAGLWRGGRRAFGYEPDGVTVRQSEATALRETYRKVLAGVSLARAARDLNDAGYTTPQLTRARPATENRPGRAPQPSRWRAQTLRTTLLNPRYAGMRATGDPDSPRRWTITSEKAEWPALVPEETWRAVDALLRDSHRTNPPRIGVALLTGVGRCGGPGCDATVHLGMNPQGQRIYRCTATTGHIGRRADVVDQFVGEVIVARLARPDARNLLIDDRRPDVNGLRDEAVALRVRLDTVAVQFAEGDLTGPQLRAATARLREKLARVETSLTDAGRVNVLAPLLDERDWWTAMVGEKGRKQWARLGADRQRAVVEGVMRDRWAALDTDRRRAIIAALMTVRLLPVGRGVRTFRPESVEIHWRAGDA